MELTYLTKTKISRIIIIKTKGEKMKRIIVLILGVFFLVSSLYSYEKIVDYQFSVRLFPKKRTVEGKEHIKWKNTSDKDIAELRFHMYLNAFKNEDTTFMKEALINLKPKPYFNKKIETGWEKIREIKVNGKKPLNIYYIQPDYENMTDQTVLAVKLPFVIKPQEEVEIIIDFESKLPKLIARTGYKGKFYLIAQWFPKLGVLSKEGEWNCHQFHRNSEFFADFGDFRAELTVPPEYIIASAGVKINQWDNPNGTKTYVYKSEKVHDFVWSAYPFYKIKTRKIVKSNPPIDTEIKLYTYSDDSWAVKRYLDIVEWGLEFFSKRYGKYPYPVITVIDPPPGAERAGGMEYPTFITGGRYSDFLSKYLFNSIEMVTFHEFGHQYWYGMIATNEFENPWMDEGLNTFSEIAGLTEKFGTHYSLSNIGDFHLGDYDSAVISINQNRYLDKINKYSWKFFNGSSYSFNSYHRTAMTLFTLKNVYGEKLFWKGMKEYFQRYKFTHPKPDDFIMTIQEIMGDKAGEFLRKALFENNYIDYTLAELKSVKKRKPSGTFGNTFVKPNLKRKGKTFYFNRVAIVNNGNLTVPVDIEIKFEKGKKKILKWDGSSKWKRFEFTSKTKIVSATIDPNHKISLERNILDNSLKLKTKKSLAGYLAANYSFMLNILFSIFPL
jgi:hypothetical protein